MYEFGESCFGAVPSLGLPVVRKVLVLIAEQAGHHLHGGSCRGFGACVHPSQGKLSPQAKETNLRNPDLGLLGDAKGRTWSGRRAMRDGFFRKQCLRVFARELGREKLGRVVEETKTAGCCNVSSIATDASIRH